jgi:hypothetical protein
MPKTYHGRMEHKLNPKKKDNLDRIASLSNPSTKPKAHHVKFMVELYQLRYTISQQT